MKIKISISQFVLEYKSFNTRLKRHHIYIYVQNNVIPERMVEYKSKTREKQ